MPLKEQLTADLTDAMRPSDEVRKSTLRMLMSAIKMAEVAGSERRELTDDQVMQVIAKQVKQRRESIDEFEKAGRQDLVDKEAAELKILQAYMPEQMGRDEIEAEARKVDRRSRRERPRRQGQGDAGADAAPLRQSRGRESTTSSPNCSPAVTDDSPPRNHGAHPFPSAIQGRLLLRARLVSLNSPRWRGYLLRRISDC